MAKRYPPCRRFRSHGWGFFAPALDIVLVYMAREGLEEGMALARGGYGLFFWQREHCKSSYESEREGRQSPPELREKKAIL